jgi:hypothetical protein
MRTGLRERYWRIACWYSRDWRMALSSRSPTNLEKALVLLGRVLACPCGSSFVEADGDVFHSPENITVSV